jgi:hypothetical protein
MKSADGSKAFFRDVKNGKLNQFLLKCLLFTVLEPQNHMLSFTGSDGRKYINELTFDASSHETLASNDIKDLACNEEEQALIGQWEKVMADAKQTVKYNPETTYGLYQIKQELNESYKDEKKGDGKVKSRLTIDGNKSLSSIKASRTARLILRAKDNTTDPNSFINIFKFDIYKNKERRYQLAEAGTLSASKTSNLASIDFKAKKYGESSYLIQLEDLEPGEYGIIIGDPNNANTKNGMKVTTFTVE